MWIQFGLWRTRLNGHSYDYIVDIYSCLRLLFWSTCRLIALWSHQLRIFIIVASRIKKWTHLFVCWNVRLPRHTASISINLKNFSKSYKLWITHRDVFSPSFSCHSVYKKYFELESLFFFVWPYAVSYSVRLKKFYWRRILNSYV